MIRDGYQTLHEIGALDADYQLTDIGRTLAKLPVDPKIGRMVLAAQEEGCLDEVLVIASALTVQDPRQRPMDQQETSDAAHEKWKDQRSDFLSYLRLWRDYNEHGEHLSHSKLRKWCQANFLSYVRMREWQDVHQQLKSLVGEIKEARVKRWGGGAEEVRRPRQRRRGQRRSAPQSAATVRGADTSMSISPTQAKEEPFSR
jgi:ATP-dependent helicase HrpA